MPGIVLPSCCSFGSYVYIIVDLRVFGLQETLFVCLTMLERVMFIEMEFLTGSLVCVNCCIFFFFL